MKNQKDRIQAEPGFALFQGVYPLNGGFHFTIDVPEDSDVSLVLYKKHAKEPYMEIPLTERFRSGRIRAVLVKGISAGVYEYNYRINGEIRQDPMAAEISGRERFGMPFPEDKHQIRCGLLGSAYDWEDDRSPEVPYEDMILYMLHVRGFSKTAPGRSSRKGTFAGLMEMIPYLQALGINAVELMPAYEFLEVQEKVSTSGMVSHRKDQSRVNYWGYTDAYYFAPKRAYASTKDPEREFKDLVKALHKAGILCIMEFYFPADVCTFKAVRALQFWKLYYHVDGFHARGDGLPRNTVLHDGILSGTRLLVDGGDFSGAYAKNRPEGRTAAEYTGSFQQDMRRFLKSDEDMVESAIRHIRCNYPDHAVVNYIASQDGFTLSDMVSYNYRHNEENGQDNQDGSSYNYSWNCGVEGPTRKAAVRRMREKQMRNAILLLMLSQGVPMLYAGDEFGNSQNGNNNAWCQDSPVGWLDWKSIKKNQALFDFVKDAIRFRKEYPILHMPSGLTGTDSRALGFPDVSLHGERAWYVNYENTSRMFGIMYNAAYGRKTSAREADEGEKKSDYIYIAYNFHWEERSFALPDLPEPYVWTKAADTAEGFYARTGTDGGAVRKQIGVGPRSIVILTGKEMHDEGVESLSDDHKA